jgi:hypothetical protein
MRKPSADDESQAKRERADGEGGSNIYGSLLAICSRPWFRFAFRAAIPIVLVIVIVIIVNSH